MPVARNAPCPCGSGKKHKLCCGMTRDEERALERELERRAAVFEEIAGLAGLFPTLRPTGAAFSAWADRVAAEDAADATLEEGVALLEPDEQARIERAHGEAFPRVWRSLSSDLGDEGLARQAVLSGAVLAAVRERFPPDPRSLELIEELDHVRADPCEALSFALECGDLWSLHESVQADAAVAALPDELDDDEHERRWNATVAAEAARRATAWHAQQLAVLVRRLAAQLPIHEFPAASAVLAQACREFERDAAFRTRLAELLLADSLSWTRVALAAAA